MNRRPTLLMPVSRDWTRERVVEAIHRSDIPRDRCILVLDAPYCEQWALDLHDLRFSVEIHRRRGEPPTADRYARRVSHARMREFTTTLVPDDDTPLLCLDDDSLVPEDVYARLSAIGPHATGVQISRWGSPCCGVYHDRTPLRATEHEGVERIDRCGHYCLLTTGETYRRVAVHAPDECYMQPIDGLLCDWDCQVGHLTERGVLYPDGSVL